jgi:hypothetical protein
LSSATRSRSRARHLEFTVEPFTLEKSHALDALLALDGNDELAVEARALSDRIAVALPDETMRRRFTESEAVQRIRRTSWASS